MNSQELKRLLEQLATGTLTAEQDLTFQELLKDAGREEYLSILAAWEETLEQYPAAELPDDVLIHRLENSLNKENTPVIPLYKKEVGRAKPAIVRYLSVAAAILVLLSVAMLFYTKKEKLTEKKLPALGLNDVLPGGNKATLTLADGRMINLDSAGTGAIASQSGITIEKTTDGQLIYNVAGGVALSDNETTRTLGHNTISTPKGGQYRVNLPDGSTVWLNAASSLRYPVLFAADERSVELTGEAYFEIAKDKNKPFLVHSKQQIVEVLGTHFNISSYPDEESTLTTLLEGSVKVVNTIHKNMLILKPGQQSQVNAETTMATKVDTEESIAWKNGLFVFNEESIPSVMRKISRWYDLEVVYEGNVNDKDLKGTVPRFKNLSEVLETLELTGLVHFKIEGRRITVIAR
ncbi:FecR protein [Pedobacter steynii]|uniref:FecR protein n=1 Tax=Pedobacter steynii TaxID=430522 RepID=A0A1G9RTF0_9SPHI|nr:FecR family protein [Pedobacter steynii]NQX37675.1 FecR domain-containing protein [Pedobacter steynii]SDM25765.1 FecR protein [Pedobacter steynii]